MPFEHLTRPFTCYLWKLTRHGRHVTIANKKQWLYIDVVKNQIIAGNKQETRSYICWHIWNIYNYIYVYLRDLWYQIFTEQRKHVELVPKRITINVAAYSAVWKRARKTIENHKLGWKLTEISPRQSK